MFIHPPQFFVQNQRKFVQNTCFLYVSELFYFVQNPLRIVQNYFMTFFLKKFFTFLQTFDIQYVKCVLTSAYIIMIKKVFEKKVIKNFVISKLITIIAMNKNNNTPLKNKERSRTESTRCRGSLSLL